MARPRKHIDEKLLFNLSAIGCTTHEMAEILEVSPDTIERRFAAVLKKGRAQRNSSLRRKQFDLAMRGDRTMLIWLGKQYLDQGESKRDEGTADRIDEIIAALKD